MTENLELSGIPFDVLEAEYRKRVSHRNAKREDERNKLAATPVLAREDTGLGKVDRSLVQDVRALHLIYESGIIFPDYFLTEKPHLDFVTIIQELTRRVTLSQTHQDYSEIHYYFDLETGEMRLHLPAGSNPVAQLMHGVVPLNLYLPSPVVNQELLASFDAGRKDLSLIRYRVRNRANSEKAGARLQEVARLLTPGPVEH